MSIYIRAVPKIGIRPNMNSIQIVDMCRNNELKAVRTEDTSEKFSFMLIAVRNIVLDLL